MHHHNILWLALGTPGQETGATTAVRTGFIQDLGYGFPGRPYFSAAQ
jgi:hypothetical protein